MKKTRHLFYALFGLLLMLLVACDSRPTIIIYVTPTPMPTDQPAEPSPVIVEATALAVVPTEPPTVDVILETQSALETQQSMTATSDALATQSANATLEAELTAAALASQSALETASHELTIQMQGTQAAALTQTQETIQLSATPTPEVTWRGPIIGTDYSLPPTSTPVVPPTQTEGLAPTLPPDVTPVETPVPPPTSVVGDITIPNLNPEFVGLQVLVNRSRDDWNLTLARLETLGVRWIKVQVMWAEMQPNNRDERSNDTFRLLEQNLEAAANAGFSVLISIAKAPSWARSNHNEAGPPDNPADLANFINILLEEINPGLARPMLGEFIDAIEIWNEPNLMREWQGTLPFSGQGYMQLFAPAYEVIRNYTNAHGTRIDIITAGLAPTSTSAVSVDDRDYLRQMYAGGLANYRDIYVGVHPYGWGNAPDDRCCNMIEGRGWDDDPHFFFLETIEAYHNIMSSNNHGSVKLWTTEFGWATWDGFPGEPPADSGFMRYVDRIQQGEYVLRALEIGESSGYMGPMILWNLDFALQRPLVEQGNEQIGYSILIPGNGCQLHPHSDEATERPLHWMLFDAVRHDQNLTSWCT